MYLQSYCSQAAWKYKREEAFREYMYWFCSELEVPPEHEDYPE